MTKIKKIGKATIVNDEYVIKESNNSDIYEYLKSRNFNYFPNTKYEDRKEIQEYVKEIEYPQEQKFYDLINITSLLHSKTTYFKENENELNSLIDDIINNINYLYSYYADLITKIEEKVIMSPSEYLLARNISKIYYSLENGMNMIKSVKIPDKIRNVVVHNNLSLDHYIRNENEYLISWDKAKFDIPIIDLYKLFRRYPKFNYMMMLEKYEYNYPLLEYEKNILLTMLSIPDIITITSNEIENVRNIKRILINIDILPNYTNHEPQNKDPKQET